MNNLHSNQDCNDDAEGSRFLLNSNMFVFPLEAFTEYWLTFKAHRFPRWFSIDSAVGQATRDLAFSHKSISANILQIMIFKNVLIIVGMWILKECRDEVICKSTFKVHAIFLFPAYAIHATDAFSLIESLDDVEFIFVHG